MNQFRVLAPVLAVAALLAGCGGATPGEQSPRVTFGKIVSFGDSLSDVGTYDVGVVSNSYRSTGRFSINGIKTDTLSYVNWTEFLAGQLKLTAPCAAETGLQTSTTKVDLHLQNPDLYPEGTMNLVFPVGPVAVTEHTSCTNYAQGGARVTELYGPGNVALFNPLVVSTWSNALGMLTKPVTAQMDAHVAAHGNFAADDLVTVMAGGNDAIIQLAQLPARIQAYAVANGGDVAAATAQASADAVAALATAGTQLATAVHERVIGHGAQRVLVLNLPDLSKTPFGYAQTADTQALIVSLVDTFNAALKTGLAADAAQVLLIDTATVNRDQALNPAAYGLSNVKAQACDAAKVGSSLFCTASTLITATDDVLHYEYADGVHPTPFGYKLLAQLVAEQMSIKGWL